MSLFRLIARLDIKGENVVKGIQMEGLRVMGSPETLAAKYAQEADELLYIDTVATLYGRNQLEALLERTCEEVFIPVSVGGGIRSLADAKRLLAHGADKIAVNTECLKNPSLVGEISQACGSQALMVSIEAKKTPHGWEAYTDNGRNRTGKDAVSWAFEAVRLGAGELLLTSVDRDGTRRGFDVELISAIAPHVPVPVVACGGLGTLDHLRDVLQRGKADAVACASVLHCGKFTIPELKAAASDFARTPPSSGVSRPGPSIAPQQQRGS